MRKRKNKNSEFEGKKFIFFQIGLIIALLSVLYAFEYKSYEKYEIPEFSNRSMDFDVELVHPTIHKKKLPPKPIIVIKLDLTEEIESEDIIFDASADEETPTIWEPPIEPEPPIIEHEPFVLIPGVMPSFPGGITAMRKFLADNIVYPSLAKEVGITGIVYLEFIIEKDGSITNIKVLKEINGGCGEEAGRVVNIMPKWKPGKQNGRPVRVKLTIPVKFSLL